jgi:uncharacterized protein (DUF4415 family)
MSKLKKKPADISQENWDSVDSPEWTAEDFKRARPAKEVLPPALLKAVVEHRKRGQRGAQKTPTKVPVKLRVDPDVLQAYKDTGDGYQTRMAEVLRKGISAGGKRKTLQAGGAA